MSDNTSAPVAAESAPSESGAPVGNNNTTETNQSQGESGNAGNSAASDQIDAIKDAVDNGEISEAEANKMIRKFELKIRGKTVSREVDLSDDDFLKNQFQLAEVAKMSQQEKAEQEKLFREILGRGKNDLGLFMKEVYGIDPDEWAAAHIEKKIEHLKKSPEVLEKEKIQEELRQAREESKKLKEEKEAVEMTKMQQEDLVGLQEEITKAISAHTKLPNSKLVQKRMAQALDWAVNNGYPDATADDVAPLVEHEMRSELNELYDQMPEEVLEAYVGKKNIERLRKSKIAKAKDVTTINSLKATASKPEAPKFDDKKQIDAKKFWRGR